MAPFLDLTDVIKSSGLGSSRYASGPSSEIGATFSGCKIHQQIITMTLLSTECKARCVIEKSKDLILI